MFAFGTDSLKEFGIGIETTCQLMGIPFVQIILHGIIPRQGLVTVQRVGSTDAYIGKEWIFLQQTGHLLHICLRTLSPTAVVGLIEGSHTDYGISFLLAVSCRGFNQLDPLCGFAHIIVLVQNLVVTVESNASHSTFLDQV